MSMYRKLTTLAAVAALGFGLAACGGGGGSDTADAPAQTPPPPMEYDVALPDGHGLSAGTTSLPMGDTVVGDTTITCPAADGCTLTVSMNPVTGLYDGSATGGMVTVAVAEPPPPPEPPMEYNVVLPTGHGLADGETMIAAGSTVALPGGTELTCDGTEACTVTISTDPVTGLSSASSTGGMVTVTTTATRMAAEQERIRLEHEGHRQTLSNAQDELARVQGLFDAGDATANQLAAAKKAVADAMMLAGNQPPPPTPPTLVAASGELDMSGAAQGELLFVLPNPGDSDTINIPAGETVYRRGVAFTCNSEYACTVTVSNNLGAIVASWSSQQVEDGDTADVAAMYASGGIMSPHGLPVTLANLVRYYGWAEADLPESGQRVIRTIPAGQTRRIGNGDFTCPAGGPDCRVNVSNTLGSYSIWWSRAEVTVAWTRAPDLPPTDTFAELNDGSAASIGAVTALAIDAAAAPGATPPTPRGAYGSANHGIGGMGLGDSGADNFDGFTLTGALDPNTAFAVGPPLTGSTMSVGMDNDEIEPSSDMASFTGWDLRALFRDWGDTAGTGDGGFETGVLVASDIQEPTAQPFDAMLAGRFANASAQASYAFTVLANGTAATAPAVNTSVAIPTTPGTAQLAAIVLDSGSLVPAQDQDINVNAGETFTGTYFGAPGQYQCYDTTACGLARNADGTVGLADVDTTTAGIQAGTWTFTPDAGAMIMVPDQDWMVFGAWLTTPDVTGGTHRLGVFFNGMDPYGGANNVFAVADPNGLHGSATYSGGAVGTYRDGMEAGLFTAEASLTANFDVDGDGTADTGDYTLSGRIDNFRGTDGVFLGADTQDMPNDPMSGGENDWVVSLGQVDLTALTGGAIAATGTTGSADGVSWTGMWSGQLYGAGDGATTGATSPTGIAGQFQSGNANTSVVGAFGAQRD